MRKTIYTCLFLLLLGIPLFAKTVKITLVDGTVIEGQVIAEYDTKYIIKTIAGKVEVMKNRIKGKPEFIETPLEKYQRIVEGKKITTAEDHIKIANWCKKNNLQTQYFRHLHEAIQIDPENETANRAMGKVQYVKKWIEDGKVKTKKIWVTKKEYDELHEAEMTETARVKARKDGKKPGKKGFKVDLKASIPPVDLEDWQRDFAMPYIRDLGANSWRQQDRAINTLISQEFTDKLIPLILKTVFDGNDKAREGALEALIRLPYPNLLPYLEDRLENDKAANVRMKAVFGLGVMGDAHSVSILLKVLDPADMELTREVLASLENITFLPSGAMFTKPDPIAIRNKYKTWLSKHSGKTRQQILDMVLKDGGPYEKIGAVKKLYTMGNFESLQTLIDLLRHEKEDVQAEANTALVKLTGVDQGFKATITFKPTKDMYIQNWVDWFEKERERRRNQPKKEETAGKRAVVTDKIFMDIGDGGDQKEKAKKTILEMPKSSSIPLLIRGLNHGDFYVRNTVYNLLITITKGEVIFNYDPKEENETIRLNFIGKWEKWWEENKDKYTD